LGGVEVGDFHVVEGAGVDYVGATVYDYYVVGAAVGLGGEFAGYERGGDDGILGAGGATDSYALDVGEEVVAGDGHSVAFPTCGGIDV